MFSSNATQVSSANYIEDVFSTYLYTGNDSAQTITNNIDLSTKGGMVWWKSRSNVSSNLVQDTTRGINKVLRTNTTDAETTETDYVTAVSTTGFSVGASLSVSPRTYASWTFRKQPKFFDVVTYTGNGTSGRAIAHSLGSTPGCVIVKCTTNTYDWMVYHRSLPSSSYFLKLNTTAAQANVSSIWSTTAPTATDFYVGSDGSTNGSGETYVAYIFAHDAGGFGLSGSDNVISCGSYTGNGSSTGPEVNIGYEPQWLLIKEATQSGNSWSLYDNMRGLSVAGPSGHLRPNDSAAEDTTTIDMRPTATGFQPISSSGRVNRSGETFIYIAIRRGPMKVPTSGTSVFSPVAQTNSGSPPFPVTAGFPVDSAWFGQRNGWGVNFITSDRLRGATNLLLTTSTNDEATNNSTYGPSTSKLDSNTQFKDGMTNASEPDIYWMFQRAPSFFDEVCYTGTGSVTTRTHNLQAIPELIIGQCRSNGGDWVVYSKAWTDANPGHLYQQALNSIDANKGDDPTNLNSTWPTSTTLYLGGTGTLLNSVSKTYVVYLFATCTGVSKVGLYTGTGSTQTIDCGITAGARFVLIKRVDSSGNWYVWDTARGMVSGTDPKLALNSTAAETNANWVYTTSTGFQIVTNNADVNASGGSYIFLAIA